MSIRRFRALMALGLYAVAVVTALTADSLARSAEMSGLSYNATFDRVMVVGCIVVASALLGWNVGEEVYRRSLRRSR
jgi:putative Mn2+ efflux pump MntP